MRRVLTQTVKYSCAVAFCAVLPGFGNGFASETAQVNANAPAETQPAPAQAASLTKLELLPIRSEFINVRENDSLMTWKIQKFHYIDGTSVSTVAGIQFEEALGLSVMVLDPPGAAVEEKRPPGENAQAEIQVKNLLVDLKLLSEKDPAALGALPACDHGSRRAVVFIRANQTARTFGLSAAKAATLTQYGRAACLSWNSLPIEP